MLATIELIEWHDACVDVGWEDGDNELSAARVFTVGKVMSETDTQIVVAGTFSADDNQTNNRMVIPKDWVTKRKVIHKF